MTVEKKYPGGGPRGFNRFKRTVLVRNKQDATEEANRRRPVPFIYSTRACTQ